MKATLIVLGIGILVAAVLVPLLSGWLRSPGARAGASSGTADALGSFIDVFDPARARADRDLQEHHNAGPVTRTPDDEDDPVRLIPGPDGHPRAIAIRKSSADPAKD
ncbi:MAG: hypothetical protein U0R78_08340 [Nocardioidaceae bacterium]